MNTRICRITLLLIGLLLLGSGCGISKPYREMSMQKASEWMEKESGYLLVDVRTAEEYEEGHIPGAILLPIEEIRKGKLDALPDPDQTLLIYCRTGRRAEDAAAILVKEGYSNVYAIGGIFDWTGEIVSGPGGGPEDGSSFQ